MDLNSDRIKKLLTTSKNLNLIVTKPIKFYKEYKKCDVYNPEIQEPLHKVWLKTPCAKTLNSAKFKDDLCRDISLGLAPMTKEIKIFCNKIKKIESFIAGKLNKKHKSSIKKLNDYMVVTNIKTPNSKNKFNFNCYDPDNRKLDFGDVEKGEKISGYIELSEVWLKGDEIGFNWSFLQCKIYNTFDFNKCLFDDEGEVPVNMPIPPPPIFNNFAPLPPPMPVFNNTNKNNNNNNNNESEKKVSRFIPTAQDLLGAINKLKSTKDTDLNKDSNKDNQDSLLDNFDQDLLDKELDCVELEDDLDKDNKKVEEYSNL